MPDAWSLVEALVFPEDPWDRAGDLSELDIMGQAEVPTTSQRIR